MRYQVFGPDRHPALTLDGKTPLPGHQYIEGAEGLLYDNGLWDQEDPDANATWLASLSKDAYPMELRGRGFFLSRIDNGERPLE